MVVNHTIQPKNVKQFPMSLSGGMEGDYFHRGPELNESKNVICLGDFIRGDEESQRFRDDNENFSLKLHN